MKSNYGFNVWIKHKDGTEETRHNVTEIHYNYPSAIRTVVGVQVAFESDIHGTGGTIPLSRIVEFEAVLAKKKEKDY
ncbi:MAG TPA: hypothetical protein ENI13_00055 [candidate division CPR3 bacterium]|uniref:Uncharacterized protein n=1 Tax=candidate division CPR3 bacterium TaxID=2268181 RepID=A0A7C1NM57_UNCC3|nr:hypothetical protein [candidate division CPR3 bacterium]